MQQLLKMKIVVMVCLVAIEFSLWAGEFHIESAGARFGFSTRGGRDSFYQTEIFNNWHLPWEWNLGSKWKMKSRLDFSAGSLTSSGDTGFLGALGPSVVFEREKFPIVFAAGTSATFLSRDYYETKDFGIPFQFTTHGGLAWQVAARWNLGYRYQHMSNAGITKPNPGLNVHMFAFGYQF